MEGSGRAGTGADADAAGGSGNSLLVLLSLLLPLLIMFGVLYGMYLRASNQGLLDALRKVKARRDRSQKRRSTKAGSNFKQKCKFSQDGKGGRSANS